MRSRKLDVRLPGKGNSNSHEARPVHQIGAVVSIIIINIHFLLTTLTCGVLLATTALWRAINALCFRDGLVCHTHRLDVSLSTRLERNTEETTVQACPARFVRGVFSFHRMC